MTHKLLGTRVLVTRSDSAETTEGGIVLPNVAKVRPSEGVIVAVGDKVEKIPGSMGTMLEVGQKVTFQEFAALATAVDNIEYILLDEKDIVMILDRS